MKKLILVTLLCCSLTGVSYGQKSSNNGQEKQSNTKQDNKPEKPTKDNPPTEKTHCTSSEGSWKVDAGVIEVSGKSGETNCETTKSGKDPK